MTELQRGGSYQSFYFRLFWWHVPHYPKSEFDQVIPLSRRRYRPETSRILVPHVCNYR
ncbi:hypothetical protein LY76DRAFT_591916 [Colletotrichum caudatum]|nr:hypothetical protein LY76DRAFT_591916 [Colletotrichum caudatum]